MGLIDNLAKRVAEEIIKSPKLPAGSVTMTEAEMRNNVAYQQQYGNTVPLDRDQVLPSVPFGPGNPLLPGAINPVGERGRPDPRRYEYQVAQNINITATKLVPFDTLRAAADQVDIIRRCLEVIKNKMVGLDWDITISDSAGEKIIGESSGDHVRAMSEARDLFNPEIERLRAFWSAPDKANGLTFADWFSIALEEILVLDAWAVWPQPAVNGDLYGFQILDGSTIKPLLDDRGMRPMAPFPAYQQILYGFPRSEFSATNEDADGEFSADELAYMVRNRRTFTVYGYSPVERCLPLADLYLKRQAWLRAEYTDGVMPEMIIETDATFGNQPELLRAYENILNDDLAGQTEQRVRAKLLPAGLTAKQFEGYGERFKDVLDDYLVTSICGHFGVLPTEIGFTPKSGLGGAGHQQGEAQSAELIGLMPLANWVSKVISNLSYTYLGMPRELEFKLMPADSSDTLSATQRDDILTKSGKKTLNEARADLGLPLLDLPEADMPILVAGSSVFLFTPEGIVTAGSPTDGSIPTETPALSDQKPTTETPVVEEPKTEVKTITSPSKEEKQELAAFQRWINKGIRKRTFNFERVDPIVGDALNKCLEDGDIDTARSLISAYTS